MRDFGGLSRAEFEDDASNDFAGWALRSQDLEDYGSMLLQFVSLARTTQSSESRAFSAPNISTMISTLSKAVIISHVGLRLLCHRRLESQSELTKKGDIQTM
jgi:hypothetical protein